MTDTSLKECYDCGALPGELHKENCDTARCKGCGAQLLFHFNECGQEGTTIWTGRWPGDEEVEEGLAEDLNDLAVKGATDQLRWDGQRWQSL